MVPVAKISYYKKRTTWGGRKVYSEDVALCGKKKGRCDKASSLRGGLLALGRTLTRLRTRMEKRSKKSDFRVMFCLYGKKGENRT